MAIRENQLTDLSYIGVNDKVRLVTSGGASNNGPVSTLAETILAQYTRNITADNETVVEAIRKLDSNAFMGQGYTTCFTEPATAAKTASISGYDVELGGIVAIRFYYAVPANATLNISNTGAYPIYHKNANITAGIINAGDICTFIYDGSHYVLISKDSPIIVETGTTSSWKYIKYSDGRIDLVRTMNFDSEAGSQWGSSVPASYFYYQDQNISLPSGLLVETPTDIVATSGNTQWWIFGVWGVNSNTVRLRMVKIVSSAQAAIVRVRVIGRWR